MTQNQIQASRENGAKSRGPLTPEGKQKSSQNAVKHGLCSRKHLLLPDESEDDYRTHNIHWMRQLQPQTGTERNRAEAVAYLAWQIERYQRIEVSMLAVEMEKQSGDPAAAGRAFHDLANDSRALDLMHRYMTRARREFKQELEMYHQLVARRKEEQANDERVMDSEDFRRKWACDPDSCSDIYFGKLSDRLPNEPDEPGIYTALILSNRPEAA